MTDFFCGAGGSSTGAVSTGAVEVTLASNHWDRAIEVHGANHPTTDHACVDLQAIRPSYFPTTDILWASPECTNHSVAKGRKVADRTPDLFGETLPDEASERSRATMFTVPDFAEYHRYRAIIVENVVDVRRWVRWPAWVMDMQNLGYDMEIVYLNAMHAQAHGLPAPQSRDRIYIVLWLKGTKRPDLDSIQRPKAWCPSCDETVASVQTWKKPDQPWGRYRAQYYYRCPKHSCRGQKVEPGWLPASTAIDWSIDGQRIGDRTKPLSPKTMARIREGLRRYGREILSLDAVHGAPAITPVEAEPFRTQTTAYTRSLLIPTEGRDGKRASSTSEPLRTQTTRNELGLLMPYYGASETAKPTTEPIGTLTATDRYAMITLRGQNAPKPTSDPLDTVAASGNHHGLMSTDRIEVEDCTFRMLEPHEIAAGMAFPRSYVWSGTKRERVRMSGNAVVPPAARDLVTAVAASLA